MPRGTLPGQPCAKDTDVQPVQRGGIRRGTRTIGRAVNAVQKPEQGHHVARVGADGVLGEVSLQLQVPLVLLDKVGGGPRQAFADPRQVDAAWLRGRHVR